MKNILITAPSLKESDNVSGVSSVVRNIISSANGSYNYQHFRLGKKDSQSGAISWLIKQVLLGPQITYAIIANKIDVVHLNTGFEKRALIRDFIVFLIAKMLFNRKVVFHIHGGVYLMAPPCKSTFLFKIIHFLLKNSNKVLTLSKVESEKIKEIFCLRNSVILPNAVDTAVFKSNPRSGLSKVSICFFGRVVESKGIFVICDALNKLGEFFDQFELKVFGAGDDLVPFLSRLNSITGLNAHYGGVASGEEKWKILGTSDVFLLPSLYGEGLPMALLESMGSGVVPIVTDDASIGTVVQNKKNGFIVEKGDSTMLAETIIHILNNRDILSSMSVASKETIEKAFSLENYLKKLEEEIYVDL